MAPVSLPGIHFVLSRYHPHKMCYQAVLIYSNIHRGRHHFYSGAVYTTLALQTQVY